MYLMALTNLDYFIITVFLALIFLIAYVNRRKNPDSDSFLFAKTRFDFVSHIEFGIIEIILAGVAGAVFGFNAIYYVFVALIIQSIIQTVISKKYALLKVNNFNDYVLATQNKTLAVVTSIINVLLLLVCVAIAISTSFKLLQAIMGFGYINNVMGLLGFTVMCILIGGRIGISYTKLLYFAVIFISFIAIIILGIHQIGGISAVSHNLTNLALANGFSSDYYSIPKVNLPNIYLMAFIILGFAGFRLISYQKTSKSSGGNLVISLIISLLLILPGVLALATINTSGVVDGKKIVTVMAALPDGQTGYVVKAVDNQDTKTDTTPGIIPPLLNTETNILEQDQYNYNLANIVVFRHYLPGSVMILALLMVFAGFMLSVTNYMMSLGKITVNNILIPLGLIAKYGKIGELWSLQVFMVGFTGVTLGLSYFLYTNYDLILFIKLTVFVFIIPLLLIMLISIFIKKSDASKKPQKK